MPGRSRGSSPPAAHAPPSRCPARVPEGRRCAARPAGPRRAAKTAGRRLRRRRGCCRLRLTATAAASCWPGRPAAACGRRSSRQGCRQRRRRRHRRVCRRPSTSGRSRRSNRRERQVSRSRRSTLRVLRCPSTRRSRRARRCPRLRQEQRQQGLLATRRPRLPPAASTTRLLWPLRCAPLSPSVFQHLKRLAGGAGRPAPPALACWPGACIAVAFPPPRAATAPSRFQHTLLALPACMPRSLLHRAPPLPA